MKRTNRRHFTDNFNKRRKQMLEKSKVKFDEESLLTQKTVMEYYGLEASSNDNDIIGQLPKESKVGKELTQRTVQKLICVVLLLLLFLPMFLLSFWIPTSVIGEFDIFVFGAQYQHSINSTDSYEDWKIRGQRLLEFNIELSSASDSKIIKYEDPVIKYEDEIYNFRRPSELDEYFLVGYSTLDGVFELKVIYDTKTYEVFQSVLNIIRTIFVSFIIGIGVYLFDKDANEMILFPIERMMKIVNKMAINPMLVKTEIIEKIDDGEINEVVLIQNSILKIGSLLMIVFGPGGSSIITKNVEMEGDLDPIIPGRVVFGLFGFCDIRNFTDATEILQEKVMLFVNEIAEIVHRSTDKFVGASNKNIGDAFLLVWRFRPENLEIDKETDTLSIIDNEKETRTIADLSLISILKSICDVEKSEKLLKYRGNKKMCEKMPNYKVKMGFGLHAGWSIEGAIGSNHKIDVSYLSHHVNMASTLEEQTKTYGAAVLITGETVDLFNDDLKKICRRIDRVKLKGYSRPRDLYTVDIKPEVLSPGGFGSRSNGISALSEQFGSRKKSVAQYLLGEFTGCDFIHQDSDLKHSIWYNEEFSEFFKSGLDHYLEGNWELSRNDLSNALFINKKDYPSIYLMKEMKKHKLKAPIEWSGYTNSD